MTSPIALAKIIAAVATDADTDDLAAVRRIVDEELQRRQSGGRVVIEHPPSISARPDRLITIKEAASIARKTAGTVNMWCATYGKDHAFASKINGRGSWLISESAFRNYLAGRSNHKKS
ncbi:hypothetical protein ACSBOB_14720 [Mesorhizobium sp. ASY16-5R]|uniref:hypothetical protein n=1 Tax=Mesorhizobium sp. ASY16-5R TaxID=3445772 RepID=UPI003FA09A61